MFSWFPHYHHGLGTGNEYVDIIKDALTMGVSSTVRFQSDIGPVKCPYTQLKKLQFLFVEHQNITNSVPGLNFADFHLQHPLSNFNGSFDARIFPR